MKLVHDDGGRYAAGFRGDTGDCVARAIAIAAELPYKQVYDDLNDLCRHKGKLRHSGARTGVFPATTRRYMTRLGWKWTPTMGIGTGCTVHLRDGELPDGRLVVQVSKHVTAVIDGVIYDTYNPTRFGFRCVYGYYSRVDSRQAVGVL